MGALETTENKVIHQGDGSSVVFGVPYLFYADSDLKVYLNDTTSEDEPVLVDSGDYTVAGAEDDNGGTVTMDTAPLGPNLEELIIERDVPETQESAYKNYNRFNAPVVERGLNRLTMMVQQLTERIGRALLKPINESTVTSIPSPSTGKALKWDASGNLINSTFDPDEQQQSIADAQAAQAGAEAAETNSAASATASALSATQSETAASFVNSADVEWSCNSATQVVISTGSKIRGVDSGTWDTFDTSRTFDITGTPGDLGALNTGSEATDTHYYLIALIDTTAVLDPHIIGVTAANYASFTTADLTGNYAVYDDYARIGSIRNDASSNFLEGNYIDGWFHFDDPEGNPKPNTSSTSFVDLNYSGLIPLIAREAQIHWAQTGSGQVNIRRNGSSAINGLILWSAGTANPSGSLAMNVFLDSAQLIEAKVSAASVEGAAVSYRDNLQRKGQ